MSGEKRKRKKSPSMMTMSVLCILAALQVAGINCEPSLAGNSELSSSSLSSSSFRSSDSSSGSGSSSSGSSPGSGNGSSSGSSHHRKSSHRSNPGSSSSSSSYYYPSTSIATGTISRRLECTSALSKCTRQMTCGMALHDYRISCKQELYGSVSNCSELCQLSMISLVQTPEGNEYLNCDCGTNDYCRTIRNRTKICSPKSKSVIKSDSISSCKAAELYCKSDHVCSQSYDYYRNHCKYLISSKTRDCSRRCNSTVNILWKQKYGSFLKNCTCDSNGSPRCRKEKEAVMRYCAQVEGYRAGRSSSARSLSPTLSSSFSLMAIFNFLPLLGRHLGLMAAFVSILGRTITHYNHHFNVF